MRIERPELVVLPTVAAILGLAVAALDAEAGPDELLAGTVDLLNRALVLAGYESEEAWALAFAAASGAFLADRTPA